MNRAVLAGACALVLAACGADPAYEPSSVPEEALSDAHLRVEAVEVTERGGSFRLSNPGGEAVLYEDRNLLEVRVDDRWNEVLAYSQRPLAEPQYVLAPGETADYETDWETLEPGEYRYVMSWTLSGDPEAGETFYAACHFTIEE